MAEVEIVPFGENIVGACHACTGVYLYMGCDPLFVGVVLLPVIMQLVRLVVFVGANDAVVGRLCRRSARTAGP